MEERYPDGPPRRLVTNAALWARRTTSLRLLPLGAGPRLLGAMLIVAVLWGAFFWATSAP